MQWWKNKQTDAVPALKESALLQVNIIVNIRTIANLREQVHILDNVQSLFHIIPYLNYASQLYDVDIIIIFILQVKILRVRVVKYVA